MGKDGFLPGCTFTLTAPAGTGKTTFLLQIMDSLAMNGKRVGYISGEESIYQLAFTCKRLGVTKVKIANKTDVDSICAIMDNFDVLIIDSFQMMQTKRVTGSRKIENYIIHKLVKTAKQTECVVGIIAHLTKDGKIKGSTSVVHAVDATMEIWKGDPEVYNTHGARVVRVTKNRYGQTGSVVLSMGEKGYDFLNPIALDEISADDINKASAAQARKMAEYQSIKELVSTKKKVTLRDVSQSLGVDVGRAKRLLGDLVELGDLDKVGRGKDSHYEAGPDLVEELAALDAEIEEWED
jgi:DNA repair protein RadA/Sms